MKSKGFTLIELLVVIAIIGMLSAVILASLNTARAKARDAQRSASIRQVQNALQLYYSDNGVYPSSPDLTFPASPLPGALTPTYMSVIPTDPLNTPTYTYHYYNNAMVNADWYAIKIVYEVKTPCYVCYGNSSCAGGWWGLAQC